eukprot:g48868.t1
MDPNTSPPMSNDHQSTCQQIEWQLKRLLGIQQRSETTTGQQDQWTRQDQDDYDCLFVRDAPQWTTWPTTRTICELYNERHHNYSHTREFVLMADAFDDFEARMDPKEDTTDDKTVVDSQDYNDIDDPELDDPDYDSYLYPPAMDFKNVHEWQAFVEQHPELNYLDFKDADDYNRWMQETMDIERGRVKVRTFLPTTQITTDNLEQAYNVSTHTKQPLPYPPSRHVQLYTREHHPLRPIYIHI